ncbi:Animal haem peroxidase [Tranquillimonas rosea]|uniref:Animal haem peroxidase n=1 Tax=Tranquillimonas rosea TaxID=641238 RepID=A0A1H9X3R8_9RHOB|nr:heme peroxidase family protein [Tranquillimonas rosea]SES40537.1 Animal haem peroxidase [Tranquillimonas rosea]
MLFCLGHGQHVVQEKDAASKTAGAPLTAVAPDMHLKGYAAPTREPELEGEPAEAGMAGDADMVSADMPTEDVGKFCYYFPSGYALPESADMPELLDALADSMVEANPVSAEQNSQIPPVFTYWGQFIDHDMTANTDRESDVSMIEGNISPKTRDEVTANLFNLRDGSLGLDSLYGDTVGQGPFANRLSQIMRFPGNRAKMRLGLPAAVGGRVPLPETDNATDLLRLGFLLRNNILTVEELRAIPDPDLRSVFLDGDGNPIPTRAIIGDSRNDENLIVAQLQVLFLRFHNKLADATQSRSFDTARRLTRWHYQWLVLHEYLPTVCDPAIVDEVVDLAAPLYTAFYDMHNGSGPKMPMPLEFSVAGFRFGHSMVRGGYDHNRFFGQAEGGSTPLQPFAAMNDLFAFTGDGRMNGFPVEQLPQNWVVEWDRWVSIDPANPGRSARKIDTELAPPLLDLVNQPAGVFKHLARRNLRRGYRLSLPTAQSCVESVLNSGYKQFDVLTPEQLAEGSDARQKAVKDGGFDTNTPLWFYILKEAEVLGNGEHLGPLGSHIVANTLVGLVVNDIESYWNAPGGRWQPEHFDAQHPIKSIQDVMRFCGML